MSSYRGGKEEEKERKETATTPPHETSSIVFMEWRGSSKGKGIPLRNACNSHLIPKMDEQTCHENPPQQNAPLAIKYEPSNVFHAVPLLFYGYEFFLSFIKRWSGPRRRNENLLEILICPLNGKTYLYGEIIEWFLRKRKLSNQSWVFYYSLKTFPQYMAVNLLIT